MSHVLPLRQQNKGGAGKDTGRVVVHGGRVVVHGAHAHPHAPLPTHTHALLPPGLGMGQDVALVTVGVSEPARHHVTAVRRREIRS